jgi:hypothetical protein
MIIIKDINKNKKGSTHILYRENVRQNNGRHKRRSMKDGKNT